MYFGNCIIDGSLAGSELEVDIRNPATATKIHQFNSCLLKSPVITGTTSINTIYNLSANFVDPSVYNFKLKSSGSAAKGIGNNTLINLYSTILSSDISNAVRSSTPSAGAYE